jgi:hypothetical protein
MLHRLLAAKQKNLNFNAVLLHCGKGIDKLKLGGGYADNLHRNRVRTRNTTSLELHHERLELHHERLELHHERQASLVVAIV